MKKMIFSLIMCLVSTFAIASTGSIAVISAASSDDKVIIPITLNNQGTLDISTQSPLVPDSAKSLSPRDGKLFEIELPSENATKQIRYSNQDNHGCDFYITTKVEYGPMERYTRVFITGIPIDYTSTCNVVAMGGVNHLSVSNNF